MPTKHAPRLAIAFVAVALGSSACSDWTPIKSAHDYAGQAVMVKTAGKEIHIDEVVTCDDAGFVIANEERDCRTDPPRTYDTRRDKVLIHDKDTRGTVGMVVAGVLGAVLVPAAIIGSNMLTGH